MHVKKPSYSLCPQGSALSVFSSTNALLPSGHQVSTHNSCLLEQSISPQKTLNDVGERKPPPLPPPPPYATCAVMLVEDV